MNTKLSAIAVGVVALLATGTALGQEPALSADDTELLCDIVQAIECWPDGQCLPGTAEAVGLPHFLALDLEAATMASPSPGFEGDAAPIALQSREAGKITLAGTGPSGRSWWMSIDEQTGNMTGAVSAEQFAWIVFGACVAR